MAGVAYRVLPFEGELTAVRADGEYRLDLGPVRTVGAGVRAARRRATTAAASSGETRRSRAASRPRRWPGQLATDPYMPFFPGSTSIGPHLVGNPGVLRDQAALRSAFGITAAVPTAGDPAGTWQIREDTLATYGQVRIAWSQVDGSVGLRVVQTRESVSGHERMASTGAVAPIDLATGYTDWLPSLERPVPPGRRTNTSVYAAGFLKEVDGFVLTSSTPEEYDGVTYQVTRPRNANRASIRGAEIGYQQFYSFLPGILRGVGLQANYTFVWSETRDPVLGGSVALQNLSRGTRRGGPAADPPRERSRPGGARRRAARGHAPGGRERGGPRGAGERPGRGALLLGEAQRARTLALETRAAAERAGDVAGQVEANLVLAPTSIFVGRIEDSYDATTRAITLAGALDRPELLAEALTATAFMYQRRGQLEELVTTAMQALEIARRSGSPMALAHAHRALAVAYSQSGRTSEGKAQYFQMLAAARMAGSALGEADALVGLAQLDADLPEAERLARDPLALYRRIGAPFSAAVALHHLADVHRRAGRHRESLAVLAELTELYERSPNRLGLWWTLRARSAVLQAMGQPAAADLRRAYEIAEAVGISFYRSESAKLLGAAAAARGDHRCAYAYLVEASEMTARAARENAGGRVMELTRRYESESNQRQLDELARRQQRQEMELRQRALQERWLWTLLASGAVTLAGRLIPARLPGWRARARRPGPGPPGSPLPCSSSSRSSRSTTTATGSSGTGSAGSATCATPCSASSRTSARS